MRSVLLLVASCGRVGFSPTADGGSPPADTSGPQVDAGPLADAPNNTVVRTFGERTGADVTGVTVDTFISSEAGEPFSNYGATEELRSEQDVNERILLRFDLGSLPATATVFDARVTVNILQVVPPATLTPRRLLEAWTEGNADGAAGVANSTQRTAVAAWTTLSAGSPGSSSATPMGTAAVTATGDLTIQLDAATVQGWVADPVQNFGMIFFNSSGESVRFASSEHATAGIRPLLTVTYVP